MLTDEQLEIIEGALIPLFQYLEREVIADVVMRINQTMAYTRTAELRVESMQKMGYSPAKIRSEAMKMLKADEEYQKTVAENTLEHKKEVKRILQGIMQAAQAEKDSILSKAADLSYLDDIETWREGGKELTDNSFLPQLVKAIQEQTATTLSNLTKTTGFKTKAGFEPMEKLYRRELDQAIIKVCTGTYSREEVIHNVVCNLAGSGLRTIDYASGYTMQLDTAVRVAMRTGAHQLAGKITDENIKQTGENLVWVSKHWGARNEGSGHANHEQWQGKVYFIKDGQDYSQEAERIGQGRIINLWDATGYSVDGTHENDPLGLYGYHCRHRHYPWFLGISDLPKEDKEPQPITLNGKTYDYYAITQRQRAMERSIRTLKREREALKALDMDTKAVNAKIKKKIREYEEFCESAKVDAKMNRLWYEAGTSDLKKTKAWQRHESEKSVVAESLKSDTMDTAQKEQSIDVHTVGKIDKEIYKCITEDIVTDEVIITDERIQHVKERHPSDYERFCAYIPRIIAEPDYIIRANKPNTATILKEITEDGKKFQLVLRIKTSEDNPEFKNSVITFLNINERTWNKYLRNKEILYKRE